MPYKVTVTVENEDGASSTHITEYGELPTLLAIEDGLSVELDMMNEYKYWQTLFGGCEFNILTTQFRDPIT